MTNRRALRLTDLPPDRLAFGTATASYQIEGAVTADGRTRSIWDVFCDVPGAIKDGSSGAVACGSYERLKEDLALLTGLGVDTYRFSVAWPRVQPSGRGPANPAGLDYYERLLDGLLERDILPMATLYHWDLPQELEETGGWPARDTASRFADYTAIVAAALGDRVRTWATFNEPWCSAFLGYCAGVHAPGRREPAASYAAAHHLLLGHGLGARVLKEQDEAADVGIVLNLAVVRDAGGPPEAIRQVDSVHNELWLDALLAGRYPEDLPALADLALVREGDLEAISARLDWLGVNYYSPTRVAAADSDTRGGVGQTRQAYPDAPPHSYAPIPPLTTMGWEVDASALTELLLSVSRRAPGLALAVTENGAACADTARTADGAVDDQDRISYLRDHIAAVQAARSAGADVRAYVAWTLLDNFEWAEGYTQRFGLVEVEADTLRRVPKRSYDWLSARTRAAHVTP